MASLLMVMVLLVSCATSSGTSLVRRLGKRVELLEDKLHYESKLFRNDLERIFDVLNATSVYDPTNDNKNNDNKNNDLCDDIKQCTGHSVDDSTEMGLTVMKRAFSQEKSWLRKTTQELDDRVSRVTREVDDNLHELGDNLTESINGVTKTCTSLQQQLQQSLTKQLDELHDDISAVKEEVKNFKRLENKVDSMVTRLANIDRLLNQQLSISSTSQDILVLKAMLKLHQPTFIAIYEFGSSVYALGSTDTTWAGANDICIAAGAHLPYIESGEENDFMVELGRKVSRGVYGLWLGARDVAKEGTWVWDPLNDEINLKQYNGWFSGQPDNAGGSEHCLHLWSPRANWNDIHCTAKLTYICEIDVQ